VANPKTQGLHTRLSSVIDFAGPVLLLGATLILFGGGSFLLYLMLTRPAGFETSVVVAVVILWASAFWLGRLGRREFYHAMVGGSETVNTLTDNSVLELMSHGVALRDPDLREEFRQLQSKPPRDVYAWVNSKLIEYPDDTGLLFLAAQSYLELGIARAAEEALRKIKVGGLRPDASWIVDLFLAQSLYLQDRWNEAELLCESCLKADVSARRKATFIDQLVCQPLFSGDLRHFAEMEKWARKALELDPRNVSLRGTLGGILAEKGSAEEAEQFLGKCVRSKAPHDRAISTFYLGVIERRAGNLVEAERRFEQALSIWSSAWFVARVQRELAALQTARK
jgi:tetratricopeptide (TPR) repeat protein